MEAAIGEARAGASEQNGVPIGSVLVIDGRIVVRGRVQPNSPILLAEMDCLRNAGRLTANECRRARLYTTLSPCDMCSGAILLFKIPKVVIGENRTFPGSEEFFASRGVTVEVVDDDECSG